MGNKKNILAFVFSMLVILTLLGVSFSFFQYSQTSKKNISFAGGKLDVSFKSITGSNVELNGIYPMTDSDGIKKGISYKFSITGYNENKKDIYYRIYMNNTNDIAGKTRFKDSDVKIAIYRDNELVLSPSIIENFANPGIFFDVIPKNTLKSKPITKNYEVKLWISDKVKITDTIPFEGYSCYSQSEYPNMYFKKDIYVEADFSYDDVGYLAYDTSGGLYMPKKTSLSTQKITVQKPYKENKGFLGWSESSDSQTVDYKVGDTYTGKGKVLYAVYSDTQNIMGTFAGTPIYENRKKVTEVYFISETRENIDTRYNAATIKADLTFENKGSVKGWLEKDILASNDNNELYKLYVGSEGTTYLSTGKNLFAGWQKEGNLKSIDFFNVDTVLVTDMSSMFNIDEEELIAPVEYDFKKNTLIPLYNKINDNYKLSPLEYSPAYAGTISEIFNIECFNTVNVITMERMFNGCSKIKSLNLENFNTSKVINMFSMFGNYGDYPGCISLTKLDLNSFDTSNVTNMSFMFCGCESLENVDLSSFDTSNVTNMSFMFSYCENLKSINLSGFNTGKVTNMSSMFEDCYLLLNLDMSNFDTSNVTNMSFMFSYCENLKSINLSSFDTINVVDMMGMFEGCIALVNLDLSNFNTEKAQFASNTNVINGGMFQGCTSLKKLDISNFSFDENEPSRLLFAEMPVDAIIYVKSVAEQSWILKLANDNRPIQWTIDNIRIKDSI